MINTLIGARGRLVLNQTQAEMSSKFDRPVGTTKSKCSMYSEDMCHCSYHNIESTLQRLGFT